MVTYAMSWMRLVGQRFVCDQRGQTTLEYVLLGAGIVILAAGAIFTFGGAVKTGMTAATNCLTGAAGGASTSCT